MSLATAAVLLGALGLDLVLGEMPATLHPVRWFGRIVAVADRTWNNPRYVGFVAACLFPLAAAVVSGVLVVTTARRTAWAGFLLAVFLIFAVTSYRELLGTVWRVCRQAETDIEGARRDLSALAGRETANFDAYQVRSAALESLAENLSDGLVAPLFGSVVGAGAGQLLGVSWASTLAFAVSGAVWIKAVNTMDSMWGYPHKPLGTGAARLDDVAMWLPSRLTAILVAGSFLAPGSLHRAGGWVADVPSPNAGWPMGTLAAALHVRLEKPGVYVLNANADRPAVADVEPALGRLGIAGIGAYALTGVLL